LRDSGGRGSGYPEDVHDAEAFGRAGFGGVLIVIGNVRPNVENICFGEWGKTSGIVAQSLQKDFGGLVAGNADTHFFDGRQSSFIA
jgi:hypothetical protein